MNIVMLASTLFVARSAHAFAPATRRAFSRSAVNLAENPKVFFDMEIGGKDAGRIQRLTLTSRLAASPLVASLWNSVPTLSPRLPRTSALSALAKRDLASRARPFTVSCKFLVQNVMSYFVSPSFMCQGGDFTNHNGTGGKSIYGKYQPLSSRS